MVNRCRQGLGTLIFQALGLPGVGEVIARCPEAGSESIPFIAGEAAKKLSPEQLKWSPPERILRAVPDGYKATPAPARFAGGWRIGGWAALAGLIGYGTWWAHRRAEERRAEIAAMSPALTRPHQVLPPASPIEWIDPVTWQRISRQASNLAELFAEDPEGLRGLLAVAEDPLSRTAVERAVILQWLAANQKGEMEKRKQVEQVDIIKGTPDRSRTVGSKETKDTKGIKKPDGKKDDLDWPQSEPIRTILTSFVETDLRRELDRIVRGQAVAGPLDLIRRRLALSGPNVRIQEPSNVILPPGGIAKLRAEERRSLLPPILKVMDGIESTWKIYMASLVESNSDLSKVTDWLAGWERWFNGLFAQLTQNAPNIYAVLFAAVAESCNQVFDYMKALTVGYGVTRRTMGTPEGWQMVTLEGLKGQVIPPRSIGTRAPALSSSRVGLAEDHVIDHLDLFLAENVTLRLLWYNDSTLEITAPKETDLFASPPNPRSFFLKGVLELLAWTMEVEKKEKEVIIRIYFRNISQ
ncbi:MAG: hypothetical protein HYV03_07980 [Deltaproteobacteria bacterium]|nr:hypothetical protein [Deltaproteobacteria bacterium]